MLPSRAARALVLAICSSATGGARAQPVESAAQPPPAPATPGDPAPAGSAPAPPPFPPAPPPVGPGSWPAAPPPWWSHPPPPYWSPYPHHDDAEPPETERYYGWQNATADGIAATLWTTGVVTTAARVDGFGPALMILGVGTYALGAPIVHWAHGHGGKGFGSLAMRLVIPFSLTLLGAVAGCRDGGSGGGCALAAYTGWQVGILVPSVLDSTVLGWEKVEPKKTGRSAISF